MSTFKAYLITPATGPREYDTVRDRAKARARELGGSSEEVELPATKGGLIPFLNGLERERATAFPPFEIITESPPCQPFADPAPAIPASPPAFTASAVTAWIMDSASQRDIELAFEALGVRFGETIRERRAA